MEIKILIDDSLKVHENLPEELIKISSWNDDFIFTGSHILAGNPSMVFTYNEYDRIKNKGYFREGKRIEFNNYIIVSPAYFEYKSSIESFFIKEKIPLRLIDFKDCSEGEVFKYQVLFKEGAFYLFESYDGFVDDEDLIAEFDLKELQVMGNIHENKELLNVRL